jgi:hypothetical protein
VHHGIDLRDEPFQPVVLLQIADVEGEPRSPGARLSAGS